MACSAGVRSVAKELGFKRLVYDFAAKWMSGDVKTRKEFDEMLKKTGLGIEDVTAEFSREGRLLGRLDRILASAEARRNNALREIDRQRSALGAAVRQAIDEVEDVEFRDFETGEVSRGPPS